jgi:hypothetical protein
LFGTTMREDNNLEVSSNDNKMVDKYKFSARVNCKLKYFYHQVTIKVNARFHRKLTGRIDNPAKDKMAKQMRLGIDKKLPRAFLCNEAPDVDVAKSSKILSMPLGGQIGHPRLDKNLYRVELDKNKMVDNCSSSGRG